MSSLAGEDPLRMLWETQLVGYHGVGALCFLIWDYLITFGDEVKYIWPQSRHSPTKWVYLLTKYFGILAQARLVSLSLTLPLSTLSVKDCRMVYTTQVVCGGILMACIQAILMLRVYALYTQDRRIAVAMITLLVAEIGSMPGLIRFTLPTTAGNMCMKPITFRDIALFGVSAVLPQLLVLGLTIVKFLSGLRDGWGPIPIVSRLVRDDIILVAFIVVWVIISAALTSIDTVYGYIGYAWLLSLIPSLGCRVVISMQRLAEEHARPAPGQGRRIESSPQLTSCLFVDYSTPYNSVQSVQTDLGPRQSQFSVNSLTTVPTNLHITTARRTGKTPLFDNRKFSEFYSEVNPRPSLHLLT